MGDCQHSYSPAFHRLRRYILSRDAEDEGLGYFIARRQDSFSTLKWYARFLPDEDLISSTSKELRTFLWALESHNDWHDCLMVLVFDSAASALALDAGWSSSPAVMLMLTRICIHAESHNISFVALWVPRELNTFADTLTHYCLLNRCTSASGAANIRV